MKVHLANGTYSIEYIKGEGERCEIYGEFYPCETVEFEEIKNITTN